jgi:predicted aspartyl protease
MRLVDCVLFCEDLAPIHKHVFTIRSLKVGNLVVENVRASIASPKAMLLLGQSFLRHFKSWSVDNSKHSLLLSE